ncbi:helix-turn-helix domain-containing protein [Novosphingobium sp. PP1Y]|uniref:helix-turn-helix domain-containing protein n=1 Tax=Novosphingobium sp. PP1Y TaxID=702113 RepID=UPI00020EEEE1|nr:helix-turn-helix transcriptional regulator [Novosphingobium sp. PP1Y]CCA89802.1 transcriptional regulator, XRE family [Novosphingobium sp. PP1Y]
MAQYLNVDEAASELATHLAANVKERRAALKMTQVELSIRSGVATSHLSFIERAKANPTLEVVEQLANGLGCSAIDLLTVQPAS